MVPGILDTLNKYLLSKWMNQQPVQKHLPERSYFIPLFLDKEMNALRGQVIDPKKAASGRPRLEICLLPAKVPPSPLNSPPSSPLTQPLFWPRFSLPLACCNSPPTTLLQYPALSQTSPHFLTARVRRISLPHVTAWWLPVVARNTQSYLGDGEGPVSDHKNKANITVKKVTRLFCFSSTNKGYVYTILQSTKCAIALFL